MKEVKEHLRKFFENPSQFTRSERLFKREVADHIYFQIAFYVGYLTVCELGNEEQAQKRTGAKNLQEELHRQLILNKDNSKNLVFEIVDELENLLRSCFNDWKISQIREDLSLKFITMLEDEIEKNEEAHRLPIRYDANSGKMIFKKLQKNIANLVDLHGALICFREASYEITILLHP